MLYDPTFLGSFSGRCLQKLLTRSLQEKVLAPLFGIDEPRTDARLSYLPGDAPESELQGLAHDADSLAFVMPSLDFSGLKAVADAGRFMPPKSTWIAPKLRSGLTLFDFGPAS